MTEPSAEPCHRRAPPCDPAGGLGGSAAILAVLAGVYGMGRLRSNPAAAACARRSRPRAGIAPLAHGEIAALTMARRRSTCPTSPSRMRKGASASSPTGAAAPCCLNLWATWCVPCRKEMPALDALQAAVGGDKFEVVTINIDTRDPEKPLSLSERTGVEAPCLLFRPERQGVSGAENRRQGLRHADDVDR